MGMLEQRTRQSVSRLTSGLVVRGIAAITFGIVLLAWPGLGLRTLALVALVAAFAIVTGVTRIGGAIPLRRRGDGDDALANALFLSSGDVGD